MQLPNVVDKWASSVKFFALFLKHNSLFVAIQNDKLKSSVYRFLLKHRKRFAQMAFFSASFLKTGHKTQKSVVFGIPLFLSLATFIVLLDNYLKAPTKKIAHFVLKVKLPIVKLFLAQQAMGCRRSGCWGVRLNISPALSRRFEI